MDDPTDNPAVVGTMSAGLVGRKQRRNHRPLIVIKPEFACHGQTLLLLQAMNHGWLISSTI
ncbi:MULTISPECIES: hypothetical protein [unclassified Rhizobium]|uniref:hypothetical protein n=1 Tax=unclassified Rhizobium TaxID=2613769 RepID=UPI001FCD3B53|nr:MULTISPECIES: hypothetical protein [unclassified Rhizobium]